MPNIKSAKKRVLVNAKKTEQNKAIRSAVKTEMKKVDLLIKENKLEEAKLALSAAFSAIDSACSKNLYHANNAANKKAKLSKKVSAALAAAPVEVVEEVKVEEVAPVVEAPVEAPVKKTTTRKPRARKADTEEPKAE
jgi:small subunit ribosomal protein S20